MAKVITLGGQKGGTGKSMISRNLAVYLTLKGFKVLVVDTDDQATSGFFTQRRKEKHPDLPIFDYTKVLEYEALTNVQNIKDQFDYIIIDAAGRKDNMFAVALMITDIAVVPFDPSTDSTDTIPVVAKTIADVKQKDVNPSLEVLSLVSKGLSKKLNHLAKEAIIRHSEQLELLDVVIQNRSTFIYAISEGLAVFEYKPSDWKANREINKLIKAILKKVDK